jgi:hypothetical protein
MRLTETVVVNYFGDTREEIHVTNWQAGWAQFQQMIEEGYTPQQIFAFQSGEKIDLIPKGTP